MTTKFNYVNDEQKPFKANPIYKITKINQNSVKLPNKLPGVNHYNKWERGLFPRTKEFRDKSFHVYENTFVDRNYSGGNDAKGFHKHKDANQYKYNFNKTKPPKEADLTEEELALEKQRLEGGDVRGYVRLDIKKAKALIKMRNRARNQGDKHGKGIFGAGLKKYQRLDEINKKNNNKETYAEMENEEFGDLFDGIKKNNLQDPDNFKNATDGI